MTRRRSSLRGRVLTAMLAVTVVAVAAFGVPLGVALWREQRARAVLQLQEAANRVLAAIPDEQLRPGATVTFPQTLLGDEPIPVQLGLYGPDGRRISGHGPASSGVVRAAAGTRHVRSGEEAGQLLVAEPLPADLPVLSVVRAAVPVSAVDEELRESALLVAALAAAVVLVAAGVAFLLARRLSRPLERLADAAVQLGSGDFTVRMAGSAVREIDDLGRALDATAARLGDLLERERAFAANASHQMRTPLTALRINLESAPLTPGADLGRVSAEAVAELDRLQRTVEQLLAVARDVESPAAVLDVRALLSGVARRWERRAERAGRPLDVDEEGPLPVVRASAAGLSHALDVLVDNALTHGAGRVTVTARSLGGGLALEVTDEGSGVPADASAEIFRRRQGGARGHGIGLALARSLVEADGGRLDLTRPGPRPVFTIVIPADRMADGALARPLGRDAR